MTRIHISQPHIEVGPIEDEGIQELLLLAPPSIMAVRVRSNVGGVSDWHASALSRSEREGTRKDWLTGGRPTY